MREGGREGSRRGRDGAVEGVGSYRSKLTPPSYDMWGFGLWDPLRGCCGKCARDGLGGVGWLAGLAGWLGWLASWVGWVECVCWLVGLAGAA